MPMKIFVWRGRDVSRMWSDNIAEELSINVIKLAETDPPLWSQYVE